MSKRLANELGIPFTVPVKSSFRRANCDASVMELVAVEGEHALYRGICANRHQYDQRIAVKELQKDNTTTEMEDFKTVDGKLVIGEGEGFQAGELETY